MVAKHVGKGLKKDVDGNKIKRVKIKTPKTLKMLERLVLELTTADRESSPRLMPLSYPPIEEVRNEIINYLSNAL